PHKSTISLHDALPIWANQSLINDPERGAKGFTPEVFEKQVTEKFKERAQVDLANLKNEKVSEMAQKLLPALLDAEKQVVADYQIDRKSTRLNSSHQIS